MIGYAVLSTCLFLGLLQARATGFISAITTKTASVKPLYIFPNGTAAENLCVRADGSVLLGMLAPSALLYYLPAPTYSDPILLYNFTGLSAVYGITEYAPDVFAVVAGTFSRSGTVLNATGEVWRVDLSGCGLDTGKTSVQNADVSRIATLSNVGFLNGAATWDVNNVLVADSAVGVVYSVNPETGKSVVALNDTSMAPNATGAVRLGVNGLQIVNDILYYTNTNKRSVTRVRLTGNATAAGPYETFIRNILLDDLEVNPETGAVFLPGLVANIITYVAPDGNSSVIAGSLNSTEVPGPTSLRFVDGPSTNYTRLLISTSGGIEYPINGSYIMGGGLYELTISD